MKRQTAKRLRIGWILSLVLVFSIITIALGTKAFHKNKTEEKPWVPTDVTIGTEKLHSLTDQKVQDKLLTKNKYSRCGIAVKEIRSVVIHYTANPGATAMANRNYFNNLAKNSPKMTNPVYASSNFIVGLEGEILRIVPETEMAYASNTRNKDSISIECCHADATGKFNAKTYQSMVWMTACICKAYNLRESDIIRHHDITGKNCPKYFVEHEDAWKQFKSDVMKKKKSL